MNDTPPIPMPVAKWILSHKGSRKPVFAPGMFESYANSKTSDCWGQPAGGIPTGDGYLVAVCQPTPNGGETPVMFYDFKKSAK